jgi:hypothetical protein
MANTTEGSSSESIAKSVTLPAFAGIHGPVSAMLATLRRMLDNWENGIRYAECFSDPS